MLLAEALDERKKLRKALDSLTKELPDLLTFEVEEGVDPAQKTEDAREAIAAIGTTLDRIEQINVGINALNSTAKLENGTTVMEAIAHRDRLMTAHRLYEHTLVSVKSTLAGDRYSFRKKDDIKRESVLSIRDLQATLNGIAKEVADLDIAIQKVNWSVEIDL